MTVNTNNLVSIAEASRNFSCVTRLVDEGGPVLSLKNNVPRYLLIEFQAAEEQQLADDTDVSAVSRQLIQKNMDAYLELAK